ncbi:MAG: hypothetical protein N3A58_01490 [Spirochaetes bacterium]|nr:hypothetical protein [Spirochaetota bacterium]
MKNILLEDIIIVNPEEVKKRKNIIINENRLKIVDDISDKKNFNIINCENKIAFPCLPIFKTTILDVFSYKYLNRVDLKNFTSKENFEKFPFNIIEITSEAIAKKIIYSGSNMLIYSHVAYQMVKNSLLTISSFLYNEEKIKSSLSYFINNFEPEQEILSEKENKDFEDYVRSRKEYFRKYHRAFIIDDKIKEEKISTEHLNHFYIKKGFLNLAKKLVDNLNENSYFIIQFEDYNDIFLWEKKWNQFIVIEEEWLKEKKVSEYVISTVKKELDYNFILFLGNGVYNLYKSFSNIIKYSENSEIIYFIKNQLFVLSKVASLFTLEKFGKIEDYYYADFMIIDKFKYNIDSFDDFIDFLFVIYFDLLRPELLIIDGKVKKL